MAKDPSRGEITVLTGESCARVAAVSPVALPDGRFVDEGEIARGGSARIHRIFDKTLLRHCALKLLAPPTRQLADDRQRFIEEAQVTAQLDHPNVVPIHELGLAGDGQLYFTMKLIEGQTLEDMLAARGQEVRQIDWVAGFLDILIKVCDAVGFAHSRGVIHRDLKPANIMVGNFGQVYVMDWGIARLVAGQSEVSVGRDPAERSLDRMGDVLGTPAYMPPEQAFGNHGSTDERSDVFALGATLYHVLTGQAPYDGEKGTTAQLNAARACAVRPLEEHAATARLPRALLRIVAKAMAPRPDRRYPSAAALKRELTAQLHGGNDLPRRTFAAGELVMREGEIGEAAYIIVAGTCRAFKNVDHEIIELRRMGPGEVFGETAILAARPRSASVQALEPLTVQVVTSEELEDGVGLNTWLGGFVRTLADRFREVDERLTSLEAMLARGPDDAG